MGLRAINKKPRTSIPDKLSDRYSCLVDVNAVTAVDQTWVTDTTYTPLQKAILYLVAIVDFFSRTVYSFGEVFGYSCKLFKSLEKEFCLEAPEIALISGRCPQIFHFVQGYQFSFETLWPGHRLRS
jgi:putative transposase